MVKLTKKYCQTILSKTGLPADYCLNPYTGCQHGCVYCYARFMRRYSGHKEPWGQFVDIKINAAEVLKKEIMKKAKGRVYLSSVTDPYQPIEKKYQITRQVLKILANHFWPVTIQTKSDLVLRDLDILKTIPDIKVGFTITTLDDKARQVFEPLASPISSRLKALKKLKNANLETFIMIAPILPKLTDVKKIKKTTADVVDFYWEDNLNIRYGNWPDIERTVIKNYPHLLKDFKKCKNI